MFDKVILLSNSLKRGVRNSSPHEGVNVITPAKFISIFSVLVSSLNLGRNAANASLPNWREVSVVPNFFSSIFV